MTQAVHVPYTVEIAEFGIPDELTVLVDVS